MAFRNPNGYGTVKKLSGKRRRPFAVYVTTGWTMVDGKAKQKQKPIGYYETRPEAMIALAEYNKNPFDIDKRNVTFGDVYEILLKDKFEKMAASAKKAYVGSYKKCDSIKNIRMFELRKAHLQQIIDDNSDKSKSTLNNILKLYNAVYKFALENDICEKNYAAFVTASSEKEVKSKTPFDRKEIEVLWNNLDWAAKPGSTTFYGLQLVDSVLIHIYTGVRPAELLEIKKEDVHLEERWIDLRGTKTKAAKRIVPIHKKIMPLIEKRMKTDGEYLVSVKNGKKANQETYRTNFFDEMCKAFGMNHTPHECRHTFATFANSSKLNPVMVKKIIGHKSSDLTLDIYTHTFIEDLISEIDKFEI